jgi:hypothetical protein
LRLFTRLEPCFIACISCFTYFPALVLAAFFAMEVPLVGMMETSTEQ